MFSSAMRSGDRHRSVPLSVTICIFFSLLFHVVHLFPPGNWEHRLVRGAGEFQPFTASHVREDVRRG